MPDLSAWRTAVTKIGDSRIAYRGSDIGDIIERGDLSETLWLLLFGAPPSTGQADGFRRAFLAALDHGVTAPSALAARAVASTRSSILFAVGAGLIAFAGPSHGGSAEEIARIFSRILAYSPDRREGAARAEIVGILDHGDRLPGYGHPYHRSDPRVAPLLAGIHPDRQCRDLAVLCGNLLEELAGRRIQMNGDAAVAALLLDIGLRADDVTVVTGLGRAVGLAAHAREEQVSERPFRAPALATVEFVESDGFPEAERG